MNQVRRICVINVQDIQQGEDTILAGERVMRVTVNYAAELVNTGVWKPTSKGKLKSFLNKNLKLTKNARKIDVMQQLTGDTFKEKRERSRSNKTKSFVLVPTGKFVHEKGERFSYKVKAHAHVIKHTHPKYTQTIQPTKYSTDEVRYISRSTLFSKSKGFKQTMVNTGFEKRIIIYP